MDTNKLGRGQQIAGVAGIVLFVCLFLPWFSNPNGPETASAWEVYDLTDILLAVTAVLAIGVALQALGMLPIPVQLAQLLLPIAALMTLWSLYRLINQPEDNDFINNGWAAYLGFVATAAIAYGAMLAKGEPASAPPARTTTAPPPPPAV